MSSRYYCLSEGLFYISHCFSNLLFCNNLLSDDVCMTFVNENVFRIKTINCDYNHN